MVFITEGKKAKANGRELTGPLYISRKSTLGEVSFVALGADDDTSARVAAGSKDLEVTNMDFEKWAESTVDGDISSFAEEVPSAVWRHFRSDHLDCTGSSCHFRGACHFFSARSQARKSDILILNHHLLVSGLLADEVLPGADVLVIDEGHRLEDAASECLGLSLSEGMLLPIFDMIKILR